MITPLNGTRTHPLTAHALDILASLTKGPLPRQNINAGVVNRFQREGLVVTVELPSPFSSHKGRLIPHLQINAAGRAALAGAGR